MMINQSMQAYAPASPQVMMRPRGRAKKVADLPGGKLLWLTLVKVVVLLTPLLMGGNLWLQSSSSEIFADSKILIAQKMQLSEDNIVLRTHKAVLNSPKLIGERAASQLALYYPADGQVTYL